MVARPSFTSPMAWMPSLKYRSRSDTVVLPASTWARMAMLLLFSSGVGMGPNYIVNSRRSGAARRLRSLQNPETFFAGGFAKTLVEADEFQARGALLAGDEGRGQLQGVRRLQRM